MTQWFRIQDVQQGPGGNGAMNVYHLRNQGADVDIMDVGQEFADAHIDIVRLIQSADWEHIALLITELGTGLSALFNLIGYVGGRSNSTTPASNAWSYAIKPIGPQIKRGGKRIVGVGEGDSEDDEATTGMNLILSTMTPIFFRPITVGSQDLYLGALRYLTLDPATWLFSPFVSASYRSIGTQVTRKLGRGGNATSFSFNPHYTDELTSPLTYSGLLTSDPSDWVLQVEDLLATRGTYSSQTEGEGPD